jgi:hypothetical protein
MLLDKKKEHAFLVTRDTIVALEKNGDRLNPLGLVKADTVKKALSETEFRSGRLVQECVGCGQIATKSHGLCRYFIYEMPSRVHNLLYTEYLEEEYDDENDEYKQEEEQHVYAVALPNIYMVYLFNTCPYDKKPFLVQNFICSSTTPIKTLDDPIFNTPLPNISAGAGTICWGDNPLSALKNEEECAYGLRLFDLFLTSPFNDDLRPATTGIYLDWMDWVDKTKKDPTFITKVPLRPFAETHNSINKVISLWKKL